jgi:hypothetical protein
MYNNLDDVLVSLRYGSNDDYEDRPEMSTDQAGEIRAMSAALFSSPDFRDIALQFLETEGYSKESASRTIESLVGLRDWISSGGLEYAIKDAKRVTSMWNAVSYAIRALNGEEVY